MTAEIHTSYQSYEEDGYLPYIAAVCILIVVGAFVISFYHFSAGFPEDIDYLLLVVVASLMILIGMAGLYYYASKFYDDRFYLFIAIGWIANAFYLFFEAFFAKLWGDLSFSSTVNLLSLLSIFPFYLASFFSLNQRRDYRKLIISLGLWTLWLVASHAVAIWLIEGPLRAIPLENQFVVLTFGAIPFSTWALIQSGKALRTRLDPMIHGAWEKVFPWTFYVYGGLQPFYLFKLFPGLHGVIIGLFFTAFALKIINSVSALNIIRYDFVNMRRHYSVVQDQLKERSVLQDIGLLASSIEHNLRTPLGVIDNELLKMRRQFQANPEMLSHLEKIQEQKDHAFAATNIITILRADPRYFEKYMAKVRLSDAFNSCIRSVKYEMAPNNVFFRLDDRVIFVKAYRPLLEQAIINVLKNSIEAIREAHRESATIDIDIDTTSKANGLIRVDIRDTGCGILEEDIPKVTTLYSTRGEQKANSGIGLFISNRIMEIHGGKLSIKSKYGKGTTVSLFLPPA